jgi:hypothetical protein
MASVSSIIVTYRFFTPVLNLLCMMYTMTVVIRTPPISPPINAPTIDPRPLPSALWIHDQIILVVLKCMVSIEIKKIALYMYQWNGRKWISSPMSVRFPPLFSIHISVLRMFRWGIHSNLPIHMEGNYRHNSIHPSSILNANFHFTICLF